MYIYTLYAYTCSCICTCMHMHLCPHCEQHFRVFICVDWDECYSWITRRVCTYFVCIHVYTCEHMHTYVHCHVDQQEVHTVNREVDWVRPQHRTACTSCVFLACCEHKVALFLFPTSGLGLQWGEQSQDGHRHKIYIHVQTCMGKTPADKPAHKHTCVHCMHTLIHTDTPHTHTPVNTQLMYVAIYTHT